MLLNERGGIIDDTVITKHAPDAFYVVTNAGRRDRDLPWFQQKLAEWNASERAKDGKVEMEVLENWGLLALQGPEAASYLQKFTAFDLKQLTFGRSAFVPIEGFNLHVARSGYTGEDGFEVRRLRLALLASADGVPDLDSAERDPRSREAPLPRARLAHRPRRARQPAARGRHVPLRSGS